MTSEEGDQRAAVVAAARAWLGTPYHHRAMVRGAGADCATLLVAAFTDAGLVSGVTLPPYSIQWNINADDEVYLRTIGGFLHPVTSPPDRPPLPGDVVMWKFGRTVAHGAIVTQWPEVIHALSEVGVLLDDAVANRQLSTIGAPEAHAGRPRPRFFFSYWGGGDPP